MSADGATQFFNRTGPIKLPHKNKVLGAAHASQNNSQHVEDMFHVDDSNGAPSKELNQRPQKKFANT